MLVEVRHWLGRFFAVQSMGICLKVCRCTDAGETVFRPIFEHNTNVEILYISPLFCNDVKLDLCLIRKISDYSKLHPIGYYYLAVKDLWRFIIIIIIIRFIKRTI